MKPFKKLMQWFNFVSEAPDTVGSTKKGKLAIFMLYMFCLISSLYMIYLVLSHEPVFTNIQRKSGKDKDTENIDTDSEIEIPSLILCPEKSEIYEYSFLHEPHWISELNLTVDEVNLIANTASEGRLKSATALELLPRFKERSLEEIWEKISIGPKNVLPLDDWAQTEYKELTCWLKGNVFLHDCKNGSVEGIWLTDNSYCVLWNGTGVKRAIHEWDGDISTTIEMNLKTPTPYRFWTGNLLTNEIKLRHVPQATGVAIKLEIYKLIQLTMSVCQPLITKNCQKNKIQVDWMFLMNHIPDFKQNNLRTTINIFLTSPEFFEVGTIIRFKKAKVIEISGNLFCIWNGLSIFAVIKGLLAIVKNKRVVKPLFGLFIETLAVILLACGIGSMQYWSYSQLQDSRFTTEIRIEDKLGAPYPTISICPRFNTIYNVTIIEELNISYPLLKYITATAALKTVWNHVNYGRSSDDNYFLIHKNAPFELGYHYNFLTFHLQSIGNDVYEEYMEKIEKEYKTLSEKLNINPSAPSFQVLKRIILDPCKIVNHCIINGVKDENCCDRIKYRLAQRQPHNYLLCYEFPRNDRLRQIVGGTEYGFRILFSIDELKHSMQQLWYDSYIKQYMELCVNNWTDCSITRSSSEWQPFSGLIFKVNNGSNQADIQYINADNYRHIKQLEGMKPGWANEVALTLSSYSNLGYGPSSEPCSDNVQISQEKWYKAYHFYKQEVLFNECGCYACYDEPAYSSQITPCCNPKDVGRCITSDNMYNDTYHSCAKKYVQHTYVGNIPKNAPNNKFIEAASMCGFSKLFSRMNTPFNAVYNKTTKAEELTNTLCNMDVVSHIVGFPHLNPAKTEKHFYVMTFYYPAVFYIQFIQRDLQNFWELLGLFSGSLGVGYGITVYGTFSMVLFVLWKCKQLISGNVSVNLAASSFLDYGLDRFSNRFNFKQRKNKKTIGSQKVESSVQAGTSKIIEENLGNNLENNATVVKAISQVIEHHHFMPKKTDENTVRKTNLNEEVTIAEEENLHDYQTTALGIVASYIVLSLALAGLSFSTIQLYNSMQLDGTQTSFELNETGITPPSLVVCSEHKDVIKNSDSLATAKVLLKSLDECVVRSQSWDCEKLFPVFLQNDNFDCLISYISDSFTERNDIEDFSVKLQGEHMLWAGDIKTIEKGFITKDISIAPGEMLTFQYELWEIIDRKACQFTGSNLTCPICQSQVQKKNNPHFCCLKENLIVPNMVEERVSHCTTSYYTLNTVGNLLDHPRNTSSTVAVKTAVNAKRVMVRSARRTGSEEFMLYAGYFDLLIGINIVNIIYVVVFESPKQLIRWIYSKKKFTHPAVHPSDTKTIEVKERGQDFIE